MRDEQLINQVDKFLKEYLKMDILRTFIHCPYWMNKIKNQSVVLKGFLGGKGLASEIKNEIIQRLKLQKISSSNIEGDFLVKFAKRERIGIDCSGFAYRLLDFLVQRRYGNIQFRSITEIFKQGITRTNSNTLTSAPYVIPIPKARDCQLGDLIRMKNGHHLAVIIKNRNKSITYVHSSAKTTVVTGVHTGVILISDVDKNLDEQKWQELTRQGENYGMKYYNPANGDGVFRLKIFK